jgi:sulfide:quinone oxidoreductase
MYDMFRTRGMLDDVTIRVLSPLGFPVPVSEDTSKAILAEFEQRGIEYRGGTRVVRLDAASRTAYTEDGREIPYDLFLGVPVHKAPDVVVQSGLTEADGWIAVDPWLATKFEDVYAVGDVTTAPVPRAGVFAEGEAETVADVIVHKVRGGAPPLPYSGIAGCYIEFGNDRVARVDVDFLTGPEIKGIFTAASVDLAREKERFGATRKARWFS